MRRNYSFDNTYCLLYQRESSSLSSQIFFFLIISQQLHFAKRYSKRQTFVTFILSEEVERVKMKQTFIAPVERFILFVLINLFNHSLLASNQFSNLFNKVCNVSRNCISKSHTLCVY